MARCSLSAKILAILNRILSSVLSPIFEWPVQPVDWMMSTLPQEEINRPSPMHVLHALTSISWNYRIACQSRPPPSRAQEETERFTITIPSGSWMPSDCPKHLSPTLPVPAWSASSTTKTTGASAEPSTAAPTNPSAYATARISAYPGRAPYPSSPSWYNPHSRNVL